MDGNARFEYFKQVVSIEPVKELFAQYTNKLGHVGIALITFLYVDFLDTSVSHYAPARTHLLACFSLML
jgi:hypothetical protein